MRRAVRDSLVACIGVSRRFSCSGHIMAVGDANVFPGFLTPVLKQLSFQSHRLLFSHASAEVRGENTPREVREMDSLLYGRRGGAENQNV